MPFTPSHAIVALPFVRTPLVPAAVAVGAMTPDLPLFVRFGVPDYGFTHDLREVAATSLIALALLLVWRCVLRPAARSLAPVWLAKRLPERWDSSLVASFRETFASGSRVVWLALSLVIGVVSHIVWDSFTHEGRAGSGLLPILHEQWGYWPLYRWLQYGSTTLGLIILAVAGFVWVRSRVNKQSLALVLPLPVRVIWWLSLPMVLIAAWLAGWFQWGPFDAVFTARHLAYRVLPPACGLWAALTLTLCLAAPFLVRRIAVRV